MKNGILLPVSIVILGLLIAIVPQFVFPVCAPTPVKIMKCIWMAKAEIGVGLVIATIGLFMIFFKSAQMRFAFSLSLVCMSALAAALPTVLIGVCMNETMSCRVGTLPALMIISAILFLVSIASVCISKKNI